MSLIKKKLKELGKSQAWLAREAGVSESTVSKAVNGSGLRIDSLAFIAKALNLPVEESLAKDLGML